MLEPIMAVPPVLDTNYALQNAYEGLIAAAGRLSAREVEDLAPRPQLAGDARDVLAARGSLKRLLGLGLLDTRLSRPDRGGGERSSRTALSVAHTRHNSEEDRGPKALPRPLAR
jgi:hypothetical protein